MPVATKRAVVSVGTSRALIIPSSLASGKRATLAANGLLIADLFARHTPEELLELLRLLEGLERERESAKADEVEVDV